MKTDTTPELVWPGAPKGFWGLIIAITFALLPAGWGQNLARNPGFEDVQSNNYPIGWDSYSGWAPMTTTTNFPHSGLRCAIVTNRPNTYAGPAQSMRGIMQPGQSYACSGWTRVERGDNQPTQLTIRQIDGSGTHYYELAHGVAYSNRWTFISGTFTLNVVGYLSDLTLYFEDPVAHVDFLVDDVSVLPPYPPPAPELSSPANGARLLTGTNIFLTATFTGSVAHLTRVQFYQNGNLLGQRTAAPYSLALSNVPTGFYEFIATALDDARQSGTSAPVKVVVVPESTPLIFFPSFAATNNLWLQGDTALGSNCLRLTPAQTNRIGAVWLAAKQTVQHGFKCAFQFQISGVQGGGGDGLAFIIQNNPTPLLGQGGSGLGYAAVPNSLAVEVDLWRNPELADPDGNHISIHCQGARENNAFEGLALGQARIVPNLSDGRVHTATISYWPGKMQVFVDGATEPVLHVPLKLEELLNLPEGQAWIGFTAATSAADQNQDLLLWSFWPNLPPVISLVSPQEHQCFVAPARIPLQAEASDADGRMIWVDYYANNSYLGSVVSPPYTFTWTDVPPGDYALTLQAFDEAGTQVDSLPINISVEEPPRVRILAAPGQPLLLEFNTVVGLNYLIQYSEDLHQWQTISSVIPGTGTLQQWQDTRVPGGVGGFYRIQIP